MSLVFVAAVSRAGWNEDHAERSNRGNLTSIGYYSSHTGKMTVAFVIRAL
jgi:hypothetical protein